MRFAFAVLLLASASAAAQTAIHRCPLEDGTIAFQETPCPAAGAKTENESDTAGPGSAAETPGAADDVFDFASPFDEPATPPVPAEAPLPEPVSQDRAECEKATRDEIDAIDREMQANAYTAEQGKEYLAALLALTAQLRACKQL